MQPYFNNMMKTSFGLMLFCKTTGQLKTSWPVDKKIFLIKQSL